MRLIWIIGWAAICMVVGAWAAWAQAQPASLDMAPVTTKIEIVTTQIVTRRDPMGHVHNSACGLYAVRAPSGAKIGNEQFVYDGELFLQGDPYFVLKWQENC